MPLARDPGQLFGALVGREADRRGRSCITALTKRGRKAAMNLIWKGRAGRFRGFGFVFTIFMLVATETAIASSAWAACRWKWDCSQYPCRQVQVCDDTLDLPAIRPPEVPPIPPPTIRPIPEPTIPPLGTTQCFQRFLCDSLGNCRWRTVCR